VTVSHVVTAAPSAGTANSPREKKPSRHSFEELCLLQRFEVALQPKPDESPSTFKDDAAEQFVPKVTVHNDESDAAAISLSVSETACIEPMPVVADAGNSDSEPPKSLPDISRRGLAEKNTAETGYRYGSLPVLVSGQLVELDLVRMRPRSGTDSNASRRLVMTLDIASLGPVEIKAERSGARLSITFAGREVDGDEELAAYEAEVRELIARLNWKIEPFTNTGENQK
jgi:hypothetical protein